MSNRTSLIYICLWKNYEKFFSTFGVQLKFGLYSDYGTHKDVLKDLVIFASSFENKDIIEEVMADYNSTVDELSKIKYILVNFYAVERLNTIRGAPALY